jgi:hypothetical protein
MQMASKLPVFLTELKRRKVYRVAAVCAAMGVAISIAVPDLFGAFGFPSWAAPFVIVVIVLGFPIALVLAWAYEVKPEEPRGPKENVKDGAGGSGPVMEEGPEAFGDGQHPLAHRDVGKDVIHQVGSGLGHALGVARRAGSPTLAGKGHQEVVAAARASGPSEAVGQDPACQIAPELLFHVIRHAVAHGIGTVGQGEVGLQVFPNDAV